MARRIGKILWVEGEFELLTPLAVGGAEPAELDLPLAVDGTGSYYLPGTSLAGPIRHWLLRNHGDPDLVRSVLGHQERDEGHASWLIFEASPARAARSERRDGIKIDPGWGVAQRGFKFEREVLPRGSRLDLRLELQLPAKDVPFRAQAGQGLLLMLLRALADGEITFGAAKTRGLGQVVLQNPTIWAYDLAERADLVAWLRGERPDRLRLTDPLAGAPQPDRAGFRLTATVSWRAVHRLMVKSANEGVSVDMLPLMGRGSDDCLAAVLPGSSIKGALLARARKVLRMLTDDEAAQPILDRLFGSTDQAGHLCVRDVYQLKHPLTGEVWAAERFRGWGERSEHVAIDRFTGGASEGALFDMQTPPPDGWEPMEFRLDLPRRLDPENSGPELVEVALMLFLLRDLAQGQVPLGFATGRGLGDIQVEQVAVAGQGCIGLDTLALSIDASGCFVGLPDALRVSLEKAWPADAPAPREEAVYVG